MLYLSHSIDRLVDFLAENLAQADPFRKRAVILPSLLNQQWLMASLAERMGGGALIGVEFFTWRDALMRLSPRIPGEFELRLAVAELLENEAPAPLSDWIQGKPERRTKLARILSRGVSEAGFYGLESDIPWQQDLVRRLSGVWRFPDQVFETASLPFEAHLFGIDEMPKKGWKFFIRQGALIYQFSPCSLYWEDLCSDSEKRALCREDPDAEYLNESHLLANWGKVGRKTIRFLDDLESVEAYEFEPKETRLHCLQQDLLELRTETGFCPEDSSLELIAAGSSRLREVEILKERLAAYFKETRCDPADILVLAPDIKIYAPLIQFVFGDEMPYRIAPIDGFASNSFLQGLSLFFDLANERWDADTVFELLENRSFREKQKLDAEDLDVFRGWMRDAGVRGGWEGKQGNWSDGLKRILFGLAVLVPGEEIRNLHLGEAERLDRFLQLLERLRILSETLRSRHNLNEWSAKLSAIAEELFLPGEKEQELFSTFLRKIDLAAKSFSETVFPWQLLRSLFDDLCQSGAVSFQPNLWQAVQFSSLQPGSIRPARAIFLLGMESGSFPRKRILGSFDWKTAASDPSDVDRNLLLQLLFAAKERLSISYCHLSPDDGKPIELALPLQELELKPIAPPAPPDREDKRIPLWPRVPRGESKRTLDVKDLAAIAKNPWKWFLQKRLGIYLQKEPLFSDLRKEDFALPVYRKRDFLLASLTRPIDAVLKEKAHLLPPGVFGDRAQLELEAGEWKERLDKWGIDPCQIHSVRFSPRCKKSRVLKEGWLEAPSLKLDGIEIVGDLTGVLPQGLLTESGGTEHSLGLRSWPLLLVHLLYSGQKSVSLYSLEKEKPFSWEIDVHAALRRWIAYQEKAEESLSPLIKPWIVSFVKGDFSEWAQKAEESLAKEEDRWIRWVFLRATPCPLQAIWDEWNPVVRETFQELL